MRQRLLWCLLRQRKSRGSCRAAVERLVLKLEERCCDCVVKFNKRTSLSFSGVHLIGMVDIKGGVVNE